MSTSRRTLRLEDVLPNGWLALFTLHPRIGIGVDLATTTNEKSNPSCVTVTQEVGLMKHARLIIRFKTDNPEVTKGLLRLIILGLRAKGLRVRRMCIDATNERFFATELRSEFAGLCPVELVISAEKITYLGEEMSVKAYLGNLLVNTLDDGYLSLPGEKWLEKDFRQVVRDRGTFVAEVLDDGGHADCFDSTKLSLHALAGPGGPIHATAVQRGTFGAKKTERPSPGRLKPRRKARTTYA